MSANAGGLTLVIGSKNLSSWSLRPWLLMRRLGIPFEEVLILLDRPETDARIGEHSPSGFVPVLKDGGLTVWDSLAICEYLAERTPDRGAWPHDPAARAVARAVSAEMHAGFQNLRRHLPLNCRAHIPGFAVPVEAEADIGRINDIWGDCRRRFGAGGPFLFGRFGVADAMYAPVALRFSTYDVTLKGEAEAYARTLRDLPEVRQWVAAARLEPGE